MIARAAAITSLVVVGIIIADILIHPNGVKAASTGIQGIEKPAISGLLGTVPA